MNSETRITALQAGLDAARSLAALVDEADYPGLADTISLVECAISDELRFASLTDRAGGMLVEADTLISGWLADDGNPVGSRRWRSEWKRLNGAV